MHVFSPASVVSVKVGRLKLSLTYYIHAKKSEAHCTSLKSLNTITFGIWKLQKSLFVCWHLSQSLMHFACVQRGGKLKGEVVFLTL